MVDLQPPPDPGLSAKRLQHLMLLGSWPSPGLVQGIQPVTSELQGAVSAACPNPLQAHQTRGQHTKADKIELDYLLVMTQ